MSRTDKTAPWHVKQRDPNLVFPYPWPGHPDIMWPKWWIGEACCGCQMCTDKYGRRQERRRDRQRAKRDIRRALREEC